MVRIEDPALPHEKTCLRSSTGYEQADHGYLLYFRSARHFLSPYSHNNGIYFLYGSDDAPVQRGGGVVLRIM